MASQQPQKAQSLPNPYGLPNPYAQKGLPNPYASATISAAPVKYTEEQAKAEQQKKAPAFHNPHNIKRPQAKKAGPTIRKATMPAAAPLSSSASGPANSQQHGIDYYRSTVEDDLSIMEEKRMRNYEEKQRKKEQKKFNKMFGQWNPQAPHKPERYSNLRAYKASGGYRRKKEGFTAFLRGAAAQYKSREGSADTNGSHPTSSSSSTPAAFAKPSFAPPASYHDNAAVLSSDLSGEDAYARRMRLAQQQPDHIPPPPPSVTDDNPPPPPPPLAASHPTPPSYQGATISAPPFRYASATISAPPVRYDRLDVQMEDADNEPAHEERPAKRAKVSKAEAMMAKMGYKKGQGLGKNNDGVVTHLEVKKRKVPQGASTLDDDSGKVKSQQVWDVSGGMRTQKDEPSKFGEESAVVVTWGCVDGVDWNANAERNDGGFGPVEHVQLDESNKDGVVYIHFQSVLSALNAVNRFDEGWEFRGRRITAKFYDERKFHSGIYEH
ncbi:hypothetical protein G6011_08841 [Alternaria panax]|uniref:G-patch domain-containing protein n=1 Tax=Alternaria panax TaxID=48097 RepID=A0AAD4I8Y0_9PLEO|nr:hypothetical protein G6011_08841 [Alternaria panax]